MRMADSFVNIEDIHIDLIDQVNPFQYAFEVLSKAVDTKTLRIIQDAIEATRVDISEGEAVILWPKILAVQVKTFGKEPSLNANDPQVRRLAECSELPPDRTEEAQARKPMADSFDDIFANDPDGLLNVQAQGRCPNWGRAGSGEV